MITSFDLNQHIHLLYIQTSLRTDFSKLSCCRNVGHVIVFEFIALAGLVVAAVGYRFLKVSKRKRILKFFFLLEFSCYER